MNQSISVVYFEIDVGLAVRQLCPSFPPYPQGYLFHGKKVKERKIYIWYEMQNRKEQIIIEVQ